MTTLTKKQLAMPCYKLFKLASGNRMPALGLGTSQGKQPGDVARAVEEALKIGYKAIDTAGIYENEKEVGAGLRQSGVARSSVFITSKLWNNSHRPEDLQKAFDKTIADLGIVFIDLFLIHWPSCFKAGGALIPKDANGRVETDEVDILETWSAMERLKESGRCRDIGLSNFSKKEVERLLDSKPKYKPAVIQLEMHPHLAQPDYLKWLTEQTIHVTAYSPLGDLNPAYRKTGGEPTLIEEPVIKKLAAKLKKTPTQVLLSWGIARGTSVIPRSSDPVRLKENFGVFDMVADDIAEIDKLNIGKRYNDPSEQFRYKFFQD